MLFGQFETLSEILIRVLSKNPKSSLPELVNFIKNLGFDYSIKAFYKELKRLEEQDIVVKVNKTYSLNVLWVFELLSLSEEVFANSLRAFTAHDVMPALNKTLRWHFTSLERVNTLWTHILIILFKHSKTKIMYDWSPHTWSYLLHPELEHRFQQALDKLEIKAFRIIGGDTCLDRLPTTIWNHMRGKEIFGEQITLAKSNQYFEVIDDYVVFVKLDNATTHCLDKLYNSVKTLSDIRIGEIHRTLSRRGSINLEIKNSPALAQKLRKEILRKFS